MTWTWTLVVLSLAGNVLVIRESRHGFLLWIVANTGWLVVSLGRQDFAQATLWCVYTALALWGWARWSRAAR